MNGLRKSAPLLMFLVAACGAPRFQDLRTPSGEFCSDMPVFPAGSQPDKEYHRLGPIQSSPEVRTEAERLESLRKAACSAGGDAVIEAVNEEVRLPNAAYATVSSGTAVTWTRRAGEGSKPIPVLALSSSAQADTPPPEPEPPAAPTATAAATPTAAKSATPAPSTKPSSTVVPFGTKKK